MLDKIGFFAGSFDPVTKGHVDIITRASTLFDTLYVGILYNKDKQGLFRIEERQSMLEEALVDLDNVKIVTAANSLAVDVARQLKATHLVRGLRGSEDLEHEARLDFFNHELAPELETIYLLTRLEMKYVSSTHVRELIHFKSDLLGKYVPVSVVRKVEKKFGKPSNH